ncbi:MAG TPA: nucleoside triphosphate pyrophosphohydrolase [Candidatus Krumholzibacterium sp.]|nr:nucleoside triphosphate pyrophosphohydrolase [Candidatus Krumholzibacterium sp.]
MYEDETAREIAALRETLRLLRSDGGCPWDRERTLAEAASYMIEEGYELLDAEHSGDIDHLEEELGDVFLMLLFVHEIVLERKGSSLASIVSRVHRKIVSRHPHVFGDEKISGSTESSALWEKIKKNEKKAGEEVSVLSSVPSGLPPLRKAQAIQKKAASTGFDWPDHRGVLGKIDEEVEELQVAIESGRKEEIVDEMGDILFTAVNLARILDVDPEAALSATNTKFHRRFNVMESRISAAGRRLEDLSLEEMEEYWQSSK